jgi:hypothetical protein
MTPQQPGVEGLQRFGYADRQASFLCTVALHGGYFLGRQYDDYIGNVRGGPRQRLIDQLTANRHVSVLASRDQTAVFHLCARPFYVAIGASDNRNRRSHPPFVVRRKLMILDYVLSHPDAQFFASEQERVSLFTETLGLPESVLPVKYYTSRTKHSRTTRYFVDKNPVYLSAVGEGAALAVSFAYVDAGDETTAGLKSYLAQYRRLFLALESFRLVYVANRNKHFTAAARDFQKLASGGTDTERLLQHFDARQRHERGNYSGFTTEGIERLRRELREFSGPRYDALFAAFQRDGRAGLLARLGQLERQTGTHFGGVFETCLLPHSYDFMGPAWAK